jgi:hypothetical protein
LPKKVSYQESCPENLETYKVIADNRNAMIRARVIRLLIPGVFLRVVKSFRSISSMVKPLSPF